MNNNPSSVSYLVIIAERKLKDELLTALSSSGAQLVNTLYGKGSPSASSFLQMFGFIAESNKVVITCLLANDRFGDVSEVLVKQFHFDKPNTGIAFTVAVDKISF